MDYVACNNKTEICFFSHYLIDNLKYLRLDISITRTLDRPLKEINYLDNNFSYFLDLTDKYFMMGYQKRH
jgi:hypothetical protein